MVSIGSVSCFQWRPFLPYYSPAHSVLLLSIPSISVFMKEINVFPSPDFYTVQDRLEPAPHVGEGVFYSWRHFRVDFPMDESLFFHIFQLRREGGMGDTDLAFQIIEPHGSFAQGVKDENGPFTLKKFLSCDKGAYAKELIFHNILLYQGCLCRDFYKDFQKGKIPVKICFDIPSLRKCFIPAKEELPSCSSF